jgi:hypothetical protein
MAAVLALGLGHARDGQAKRGGAMEHEPFAPPLHHDTPDIYIGIANLLRSIARLANVKKWDLMS